jgi:hypothetical protein
MVADRLSSTVLSSTLQGATPGAGGGAGKLARSVSGRPLPLPSTTELSPGVPTGANNSFDDSVTTKRCIEMLSRAVRQVYLYCNVTTPNPEMAEVEADSAATFRVHSVALTVGRVRER